MRIPRTLLTFAMLLLTGTAAFSQVRIIQTNSGGDNIHVIDPLSNKVAGEIKGIPVNHGAAASPDGKRLYFSSEAEVMLDVVDTKTLAITKKIPLSGRPNNISISPDGRYVYVAIAVQPGAIDVIDTVSLEKVKTVAHQGGVHNVYVTPDGKYFIAGSIAGRKLTVFDAKTDQPAWTIFDVGVRPIAFETNPDKSTKRLFVQLSDFHGFAIVDFAQHKEVGRVSLPELPVDQRDTSPNNGAPSHGIGVSPDGKTLWVTSRQNSAVYAYSLPDVKLLGGVDIGKSPDWVTFTPDSKLVYVSSGGAGTVSAIDIASRKEVARIALGQRPQRNITAVFK
jgi:YVTN family beta-propeller protein